MGNAHLLVAAEPGPMNTVLNHLFFANPPRAAMPYAEYERRRDSHPWAWTVAMAQGDSFRGYPVAAVAAELFDVYQPIMIGKTGFPEVFWGSTIWLLVATVVLYGIAVRFFARTNP